MTQHVFQTEVNQLLHLIIHSLYSHKEIFLRELISNASDALDKLKYLTLTDDKFKKLSFDPRIDVKFEAGDNPTLTISDNGIGMNKNDLIENLGTIARSGTKNFLEAFTGNEKKDSNLIGQFGVGFYSCYMVADKVTVISKKVGEEAAFQWTSDSKSGFDIVKSERESFGTTIILDLNDNGKEYANKWQIESIIKKYSNHIPFSIYLTYEDSKHKGEGDDMKEIKEEKVEKINSASAFWQKPKNELKQKEYNEFYKSFTGEYDDPLIHIHTQAEGTLEYSTLFYIPKKAPIDLFNVEYKAGVKLYVDRVFITEDNKELLPGYLRFVKGIIDSSDLPLNVSREILQQNKVLAKIKSNSTKKIIGELKSLTKKDKNYISFWGQFGRPIKEGVYQDYENKEDLLELLRFKSTKVEGYTSFTDYTTRLELDQKYIYFITGEKEATLRNSPLLELYKKKDLEVLILDDEIDEIIFPAIHKYKDYELKAVNRSDAAEDLKSDDDKDEEKAIEPLIKKVKDVLKGKVKDVKASTRLSDSPSCIVADSNDPTAQMQEMLKAMGQATMGDEIKPILEINPNHPIVKKMASMRKGKAFNGVAELLFDQAKLLEGVKLDDPAGFVKRLNTILQKSL